MSDSRSTYTRDDIRQRPGMYIGSTGHRGILYLTLEVVGNVVDLVLGGRASTLAVHCLADSSIEVRDDGPGLDLSDPRVRHFFEIGHDRATADGHTPHIHLSAAGVGLMAVNALSERLRVESTHTGTRRVHEWTAGGNERRELVAESADEPSGTRIRFWPDREIFGDSRVHGPTLLERLNELAGLLPELAHLDFNDARTAGKDGLISLMDSRFGGERLRWRALIESPESATRIEIALSCNSPNQAKQRDEEMLLFCNFREVVEISGTHRAIRAALGGDEETAIRGLEVGCSLRMLDPQFSGPTRGRLDDPRAIDAVSHAVGKLLRRHPDARAAVETLLSAADS